MPMPWPWPWNGHAMARIWPCHGMARPLENQDTGVFSDIYPFVGATIAPHGGKSRFAVD